MSKTSYKILEAETNDDLQDMVQRAIEEGFMPCGGVLAVPFVRKNVRRPLESIEWNYVQAVCSPAALMPAANWLAKEIERLKTRCRTKSKTNASSPSAPA